MYLALCVYYLFLAASMHTIIYLSCNCSFGQKMSACQKL